MAGIGLVALSAMRRQWRGVLVVTLLVGLAGTVVLATVAGARRTDTSLDRFSAFSRPADLEMDVGEATAAQLREFRHAPGVAAAAQLQQMNLVLPNGEFLPVAAAVDGRFGTIVDRPRVLHGRLPRLSAPNELAIGETLADRLHVRVGDTVTFDSFSKAETDKAIATNGDPGRPNGPVVHFRVVGVVRRPLDLGVRGGPGGVVVPTPAFFERHRDDIGSFSGVILRVRTEHGAADVRQVVQTARRIWSDSPNFEFTGLAIETEGARDAIDVLTVALWVFAGVAAFAGVVAIGIVTSRQIGAEDRDQETLRSLGLTRGQRAVAAGALAVPVALGGAVLAVAGAALASPLLPFGVARSAEIDPGFKVDGLVVGLGLLAIVVFVLAIAAIAGLRVAQSPGARRSRAESTRPSAIGRAAAGVGAPPSVTTGLRMALEPGRGPTAVPVRSAFTGAVLGTVGVVAVLVFSFSLAHLADSPRLFGWSFDVQVLQRDEAPPDRVCDIADKPDPALGAVAAMCTFNATVDGRPTTGWGFRSLRGSIGPTIVAGRAPRRAGEVVLGAATLDALGKRIGDSVRVRADAGQDVERIVGQAVFPSPAESDAQALADGAAFAAPGLARIISLENNTNLVGRLLPGKEGSLSRTPKGYFKLEHGIGIPPTVPVEIERLRQIDPLPAVLAGLLALLAMVAVGHAIVLAVRRRRRDLALLRTLGFERSQVRATIAWQASTFAVLGLLVGIPLGIVVGRLVWQSIADSLGVAPVFQVSVLALLVLAVGTLLVVNVIGTLAARAAIRMRPATVLRAE
jgi:hypothetical protein